MFMNLGLAGWTRNSVTRFCNPILLHTIYPGPVLLSQRCSVACPRIVHVGTLTFSALGNLLFSNDKIIAFVKSYFCLHVLESQCEQLYQNLLAMLMYTQYSCNYRVPGSKKIFHTVSTQSTTAWCPCCVVNYYMYVNMVSEYIVSNYSAVYINLVSA